MPRPRHVNLLIALCALVLLAAQMLGALHRIQHAGHVHRASMTSALSSTVYGSMTTSTKPSTVLQALFGSHDTAGACDLYDQMSHGDALCSSLMTALPEAFDLPPAQVHRTWHLAAQSAGFLARGPPTLS